METEPATQPTPLPCPEPAPPVRLGWMQLVLRLAAGQSVEHVAALFRRAVDEVRRRAEAVPVHCLVDGLRTLAILPGEARIARHRVAGLALPGLAPSTAAGPGPSASSRSFAAAATTRRWCWPSCASGSWRVERMPEGLGRPRTPAARPSRSWPVLRSGDLPPRFEGPALRFAYAMRDELIVADARILQAQCDELKERPARDRGRPAPPHPAHRQALSRRADRRRHAAAPRARRRRCRGICPSARCACGRRRSAACSAPRPSSTSSSRSRNRRAPAASSRPTPRSTSSPPQRPARRHRRRARLQPLGPRPAPRPAAGPDRVGRLQARPPPPPRQRRLPGHHRLRPPRPATLVAPPPRPSGTQPPAAAPIGVARVTLHPSPRPLLFRHPATRSRGLRRKARPCPWLPRSSRGMTRTGCRGKGDFWQPGSRRWIAVGSHPATNRTAFGGLRRLGEAGDVGAEAGA